MSSSKIPDSGSDRDENSTEPERDENSPHREDKDGVGNLASGQGVFGQGHEHPTGERGQGVFEQGHAEPEDEHGQGVFEQGRPDPPELGEGVFDQDRPDQEGSTDSSSN